MAAFLGGRDRLHPLTRARPRRRSLGTIFQPFSAQVWLMHLFMMAAVGLAIVAMEATADGLPAARAAHRRAGSSCARPLDGALRGAHAAVVHFLFYAPRHRPRTAGGRLALAALSFHALVMSASYQAALAGFMSTSAPLPTEVGGFAAVERAALPPRPGDRVCMLQAAQGLFPTLDPRQVVTAAPSWPALEVAGLLHHIAACSRRIIRA
jgi:hypothetical protein